MDRTVSLLTEQDCHAGFSLNKLLKYKLKERASDLALQGVWGMTARSLLERAPILHFDNHLCPVFELYIICGRENDGARRIGAAIRAQG